MCEKYGERYMRIAYKSGKTYQEYLQGLMEDTCFYAELHKKGRQSEIFFDLFDLLCGELI